MKTNKSIIIRSQIIFDFKRWFIMVLKLGTMFVEWLIHLSEHAPLSKDAVQSIQSRVYFSYTNLLVNTL